MKLCSLRGLNKLNGFVKYSSPGGIELYLHFSTKDLNEDALRYLIAFFMRFEVGMKQLRIFDTDVNKPWFNNPVNYWHLEVFS